MIIVILIFVLFFKYILFLATAMPLRIINLRRKKNSEKNINLLINSIHSNEKQNIVFKGGFRKKVARLLNGYIRYIIIEVGKFPSHTVRNFLYKNVFLISMDETSVIYYGAEIRETHNCKIGKGTIIGDRVVLDARCGIEIGAHVNLSSEVHMWTLQHDYNDKYFGVEGGKIIIGDRAWIGPRVTILPNVVVGEGAVIAAGAVVTKNVEPYTLVGGVPAKKIGTRSDDLAYEFKGSHVPFY